MELYNLWYNNNLVIENATLDTCINLMGELHLHKDDCDLVRSEDDCA